MNLNYIKWEETSLIVVHIQVEAAHPTQHWVKLHVNVSFDANLA
jgi:hypothetical protein